MFIYFVFHKIIRLKMKTAKSQIIRKLNPIKRPNSPPQSAIKEVVV